MKIEKNYKTSKGITLVALVITIVILIILAVVAINIAFGDSGLISYAEKAGEYQANADASDGKLINDATDYISEILSGGDDEVEPPITDIDLSYKNIVWLGDMLIKDNDTSGEFGTGNGFPKALSELAGCELYYVTNQQTTITDNISGTINTLSKQVDAVLSTLPSEGANPEDVNLFIMDGGIIDSSVYELTPLVPGNLAPSGEKQVGTVDTGISGVTSEDTVINDFEEVIQKIKTNFPNAKILYIQPLKLERETFDILSYEYVYSNVSLEDMNGLYGTSYSSFYEMKDRIIEDLTNGNSTYSIPSVIPKIEDRYTQIINQVQIACEKWGVEYYDLSTNVTSSDFKEDSVSFSSEGYERLIPFIETEVKKILTE